MTLESGEILPNASSDPPPDRDLMRLRLERAKNLMKLKRGPSSEAPAPVAAEKSPEDDFDVHFEP